MMYKEYIIKSLKLSLVMGIIIALSALAPFADVLIFGNNITEISVTEITQEIFLLFIISIYSYIAFKFPQVRYSSILIAGFFAAMFIRELDFLFDGYFISWTPFSLAVSCGSIIAAIKNQQNTLYGLYHFGKSNAFYVTICGLAVLLIFSRIIGMKLLWKAIMDIEALRIAKNLFEEATELLGYTLCLIASGMYYLDVRKEFLCVKDI